MFLTRVGQNLKIRCRFAGDRRVFGITWGVGFLEQIMDVRLSMLFYMCLVDPGSTQESSGTCFEYLSEGVGDMLGGLFVGLWEVFGRVLESF